MDKQGKSSTKSGWLRRALSCLLLLALLLTMLPTLPVMLVHAETAAQSPVIVKNSSGTYDVTLQYQGNADSVGVRGTIPGANWNDDAIQMTKSGDTWSVKLTGLAAGTYEYKFVLNNSSWIQDPGNPLTQDPTKSDSNNLLVLDEKPVVTNNDNGTSDVTFRYAETSFSGGTVTSVEVMGTLPGASWTIGSSVKMAKTADGSNIWWATIQNVQPGTYEYKFVINGSNDNWTDDPANPNNGQNSRLTVEGMPDFISPEVNGQSVTFRYWAPSASSVELRGDMNDWGNNKPANPLSKGENGIWSVTLTLDPGEYGYKYIVDGSWVTDQKNTQFIGENSKVVVNDSKMPSFVSPEVSGTRVTFRFWDPDATAVYLVGTMNNWNTTANLMVKDANDIWSITLTLEPGTYEYKFYNGDSDWPLDQRNPNVQNNNSVVTVTGSVAEPEVNGHQVTFRYTNTSAKAVYLAGSMNEWNTSANAMTKDADGVWTLTLTLSPAVYEYKFVVDGDWIVDPLNSNTVSDGYGGLNSRVVVPGLADAKIDVEKGGSAQLPATLALVSASGTTTNVAPTYTLTEAVTGVTLQGTTVSVTSACNVSKFTVTAASGANTSTVTVSVVSTVYTYNVYYFDWNADHMDITATDLWMWDANDDKGHQELFTGTEVINGKTWLKATITSGETSIGLIPRSFNDWAWKTPDHNYVNTGKQKTVNLYIVYGDDKTYTEPPELPDEQGRAFNVPGTFPGPSWDAGSNKMTLLDEANKIYSYTFENVPAGNYEFKIAVNGTWDENYGVGGKLDGSNYSVSVPKAQNVTVYYSDVSHLAVTSITYQFLKVKLEGEGIAPDTYLTDSGLTGIYSVKVSLPAGEHTGLKLAVDGDSTERLYSDFTLDAPKDVTFYYAPAYDLYYHDAVPANDAAWRTVYFNSKNSSYKSVYGAVATGEKVTFALDAGVDITGATLVIGSKTYPMTHGEAKDGVQTWTATVDDLDTIGEYDYFFVVSQTSAIKVYCDDDGYYGTGTIADLTDIQPYDLVVYKAGFTTPDWMKNAVIYQIFPDRFFNGDTTNDKNQTSARGPVNYEFLDWDVLPENPEWITDPNYPANAHKGDGEWSNEIYGGDLRGVTEKIDYLKALGVTVIYLNPVFASISSHRYDTSDYTKIDPILGDLGDFTELVKAAEANGMHIVLDGVFNHVSDDSIYFDRYYKYLNTPGCTAVGAYPYWAYVYDYMAANSVTQEAAEAAAKTYFAGKGITDFSYTTWFDIFNEPMVGAADTIGDRVGQPVYSYDGWWGYDSMPIIKATNGSEYQTEDWAKKIIDGSGSVTQYWLTQGSNGWRLDVANEVSDETWQHFRESVKATQSDAVIIGEIWDDATKYLMGDMYDSVMNYMFRNAVLDYAKGGSSQRAMADLERLRERYPKEAFYAMMNLVSSHDTTRVLSYLDGIPDDRTGATVSTAFPTYEGTSALAKQRQYLVAFLQFTYAGAPTIYYGDERGMVGADDPDDRRTIDWTKVNDEELLAWYTDLAAIRSRYSALRTGSVEPIADTTGNILGYVRRDSSNTLIVLANNAQSSKTVTLDLNALNVAGVSLTDLIAGTVYPVESGSVTVTVPAISGVILTNPEAGDVHVSVQIGEGAPEVTLQDEDALAAAVLTDADKAQIAAGADADITLTVTDAAKTVSETEKKAAGVAIDGYTAGAYLNLALTKTVAGVSTEISQTDTPIRLTIPVPEALLADGRDYAIVCIRNGVATVLKDLDTAADTLTIEIDQLATYAILLKEAEKPVEPSETTPSAEPTQEPTEKPSETPKTGDETPVVLLAAMALLSIYMVCALVVRRRRDI